MSPTEKILATGLGAVILGATAALAFANNSASNLFAVAAVIILCLMAGCLWRQTRRTEKPAIEIHYAEPEEGVWPPPPIIKPGTGSAGLLLNKSVSDTEEIRAQEV